jgi:hypothetical protein
MQRFWGPLSMLMGFFSILSCWYMALRFYRAWWDPLTADNGTWIQFGLGIMVMEFIVVHSGGLLAGIGSSRTNTKKERFGLLTGLIALYFGFAFAIATAFHSKPLFYSFATIMFCRMITGFFAVSEKNSSAVIQRSVSSALLYMFVSYRMRSLFRKEHSLTESSAIFILQEERRSGTMNRKGPLRLE